LGLWRFVHLLTVEHGIEYAKKLERMIWMSDSEKKQTLKGLDGVSDCRKEYEEADWEEYQIQKQIAEHQARVQAEELEYLEYQLYLQENNLDPDLNP
jgi:hypothetical protein